MKTTNVIFLFLGMTFLFLGCTQSQKDTYSLLDKMVEIQHENFLRNKDTSSTIVSAFKENILRCDVLLESINQSKSVKGNRFFEDINKLPKDLPGLNECISAMLNHSGKLELLRKDINLIKLALCSYYEKVYLSGDYLKLDIAKVLVVPKNQNIKLGETYECQMYLAGWNSDNTIITILEGDTLKNKKDMVPFHQEKSLKKGIRKLNGIMMVPGLDNQLLEYPFSIEYKVE